MLRDVSSVWQYSHNGRWLWHGTITIDCGTLNTNGGNKHCGCGWVSVFWFRRWAKNISESLWTRHIFENLCIIELHPNVIKCSRTVQICWSHHPNDKTTANQTHTWRNCKSSIKSIWQQVVRWHLCYSCLIENKQTQIEYYEYVCVSGFRSPIVSFAWTITVFQIQISWQWQQSTYCVWYLFQHVLTKVSKWTTNTCVLLLSLLLPNVSRLLGNTRPITCYYN